MTQTYTAARQRAEVAFGRTQTEFFARAHAVEERDAIVQDRENKTKRLREARLAQEAKSIATATNTLINLRLNRS